jgi:hypothetical protein
LTNPVTLGLGASIGLFTGFAALFVMIHLRRQTMKLEASLAEAR